MTGTQDAPGEASGVRRRRPALWGTALWSAVILLVLGLTWFSTAAVVPFIETRAVLVERVKINLCSDDEQYVKRLGGPERAFPKLRLMLRLPQWMVPKRSATAYLMRLCGRRAVPLLAEALSDEDPEVRRSAANALRDMQPSATETIPQLRKLLKDANPEVRESAAQALRTVTGKSPNPKEDGDRRK